MKVKWLVIPAIALGLGACKKPEEAKTPETPPAETSTTQPPTEPAAPTGLATAEPKEETKPQAPTAATPEERAAKLGFVKHLPQDTEVLVSFHNGSSAAERVQGSKFWKLIESEMAAGFGMAPGVPGAPDDFEEMEEGDFELPDAEQDDAAVAGAAIGAAAGDAVDITVEEIDGDEDLGEMPDMGEPVGPAALLGTEFTIALGKSVGEQTANLLTINRRMSYFQMRSLGRALAATAESGDISAIEDAMENQFGEQLAKDLLTDPEGGISLYERMNMPPLYLAFRTAEKDRESASQMIASGVEQLAMFGEMFEPVEIEKAGSKFAGYKLPGAKVAEAMSGDREDVDEALGAEVVDKLIAATSAKNLVVLSGTVGEYIVLFIGASTDDLKLADSVGSSLAASDSIGFCDSLLSKDIAAVIHGRKESISRMFDSIGGLSDATNGLRDGMAGNAALGDTRDIETLLSLVSEREAALRALSSTESVGHVAFFEEGLKIESFGGTDAGAFDWKSPNKLASLGASEDTVLFANMTATAAYDEKSTAYFEALIETAYAVAMKAAEMKIEDEAFAQFQQGAAMFDTKIRPDLLGMWTALSDDMGSAIGTESALVIDLKGSMPAIPGVSQKIVDEAKFPRISVIAPVTDRAKLKGAWTKMNDGATRLLATASEMLGEDIPMQKPMSSDKDGFTTWFFPLPFFNDDFIPSVTVGDQWFAASTSKNQALDLLAKAAAGGPTSTGFHLSVNFKALQTFVDELGALMEKNSDSLPLGEQELGMIRKFASAMDDMDKLTIHARNENGQVRSTIHFKTR